MIALSSLRARRAIAEVISCAFALVSLGYAVITAPGRGSDLVAFAATGREWLTGAFQFGTALVPLYPPFAVPFMALLTLFPSDALVIAGLLINLAATVAVVLLTVKLYGEHWPARVWLYLAACLLASAPYRVTLRMGQNSLLITALLLAALLAWQRKQRVLSGACLGLSLCKYSLTLPFLLYFFWKREWKVAGTALIVMVVLTEIFAWHLGMTFTAAITSWLRTTAEVQTAGQTAFTGATEIKPLIYSLTGENIALTSTLTIVVAVMGLAAMTLVFARRPQAVNVHFAILALYALWMAYHRTYDSVLCILPAALLIDWLLRGSFIRFSRFWLVGLGLLIISLPGLLTERLGLSEDRLANNLAGRLGLHIERLLVVGLFVSLLLLLWRSDPSPQTDAASGPFVALANQRG
ncbi:MAG TPA: glycosyltransferase family 87 protein [Blastocatellia bacterium]|nr:glycosyltransferase family 87 protein [Blastocatellia bacterium]